MWREAVEREKKKTNNQMCSWKFPHTHNRKFMLGLKLCTEFVVDHRKLRQILCPPGVLLENRLQKKKKREKLSLPKLTIRGATSMMMQALHFPSTFYFYFEVFE